MITLESVLNTLAQINWGVGPSGKTIFCTMIDAGFYALLSKAVIR
eukprot:jgi/Antlo1/2446/312